jgi:hypothetical protein
MRHIAKQIWNNTATQFALGVVFSWAKGAGVERGLNNRQVKVN